MRGSNPDTLWPRRCIPKFREHAHAAQRPELATWDQFKIFNQTFIKKKKSKPVPMHHHHNRFGHDGCRRYPRTTHRCWSSSMTLNHQGPSRVVRDATAKTRGARASSSLILWYLHRRPLCWLLRSACISLVQERQPGELLAVLGRSWRRSREIQRSNSHGSVRIPSGAGGRRRWEEGVPSGGAGAAVSVLHLPALHGHAHLLAQVQEDLSSDLTTLSL